MKLPATEGKLMRLRLNDLKSICSTLGLSATETKADCTEAILEAQRKSVHIESSAQLGEETPAIAQQRLTSDASCFHSTSGHSHNTTHSSDDDEHTPSRATTDAWFTSDDDGPGSEEGSQGGEAMWDLDHDSSSGGGSEEEDGVWGPGRGAQELDPDALARARQVMEAAVQGTADAADSVIDPFASTARPPRHPPCCELVSPQSGSAAAMYAVHPQRWCGGCDARRFSVPTVALMHACLHWGASAQLASGWSISACAQSRTCTQVHGRTGARYCFVYPGHMHVH